MDPSRSPHRRRLSTRIAMGAACLVLGALLAQPAWAARKCADGSTADKNNLCPDDPPPAPATPQLAAQFVAQSVPTTMVVGQAYAASVTMKNTGLATWSAANAFNLGSQNPGDNGTWGTGRVAVPGSVANSAAATFNFTASAPLTAGSYNFQWRMVQDGVAWFGAQIPNQTITVLASDIKGNIDGLGGNAIQGWACSTRLDAPIDVHLYLGGSAGSGTFAGAFRAGNASEAA